MSKTKYIEQADIPAKNWDGKLYKVFNKGLKPTHGKEYNWSVPSGKKKGKWTTRIKDVKMCIRGWHLTTHFAHWIHRGEFELYEAESDSIVEFDGYDKVVCERVRLVRRIDLDLKSGDNSGDCNSGNCNSGDYNSGNYNSGDCNSGYFCTNEPTVRMFNRETGLLRSEIEIPGWMKFEIIDNKTYKESFTEAFQGADRLGVLRTLALPNFDYEIFEEISGISKKMIEEKLND